MRNTAVCAGFVLLLAGLQTAAAAATEPPPTQPPALAAAAYAQGQEHLAHRTAAALRAALQDFERATTADPTFAPAFAGLAETHALLYDYPGAREASLRAVALDDRLASAHAVLGFVKLHADWDWAGAETELKRALELDPQRATPYLWHAILLEATGHSDDAVKEARRAVELEPKEAHTHAGLGYRLYWARRYDEAVTELEAALGLDPTLDTAQYFIGRARVQQGRFDDARAAFARARQLSPKDANLASAGAYLEAMAGRRAQAEQALAEIERLAIRGLPFNSQVAGVRAALGDKTAALGWLELAQSGHEGALVWLKIDPRFESLRGEPRFQEILRRMGLEG
jgi:tetratricopeptide (TPR) repeat protein